MIMVLCKKGRLLILSLFFLQSVYAPSGKNQTSIFSDKNSKRTSRLDSEINETFDSSNNMINFVRKMKKEEEQANKRLCITIGCMTVFFICYQWYGCFDSCSQNNN